MKLKTVVTTSIKDIPYFEKFRLEVTPAGVLLSAKSSLFARAVNGKAFTNNQLFKGLELKMVPDSWLERISVQGAVPYRWFMDEKPNLVWLSHPKLAEGFELLIPSPITTNDLDDYFQASCQAFRDIYAEHLRGAVFEAQLSEVKE